STRFHGYTHITVGSGWDAVVYGDIDGDGQDEAALGVDCNNGGGTADGVLAYARVIFGPGRDTPRMLAIVTPRRQQPHELPTLLRVEIHRGKVVSHEAWYGPKDGTCCPSGRATTIWRFRHARLVPISTTVQKKPRHSSPAVVPRAKARRIAAQWRGFLTYLPTWAPNGVVLSDWRAGTCACGTDDSLLTVRFGRQATRLYWLVSDPQEVDRVQAGVVCRDSRFFAGVLNGRRVFFR